MTLYKYSSKMFQKLKKTVHDSIDEQRIITLTHIELNPDDVYTNDYIDLSSATYLLQRYIDNLYVFEKIILKINQNVTYIIEESISEDCILKFRNLFSRIEPFENYYDETIIENDSNKSGILKYSELNNEKYEHFKQFFDASLFGHANFKQDLFKELSNFRLFNKIGNQKTLSFFLLGDTGVGKTEVARCLNSFLDKNNKLVKINFGNYSSKDALNSLIGSPRGFIGSESGELSNKISKSNTGIILFDEFEKADSKVLHFFLELLEDGKFTDSMGKEYDLNGYIIILTSNLSKADYLKRITPELRSRINYVTYFNKLCDNDKRKYVEHKLLELSSKFENEYGSEIQIKYDPSEIIVSHINDMRELNIEVNKYFSKLVTGLNLSIFDT